MLRLAFDFIITWRETRTRPNAYPSNPLVTLLIGRNSSFLLLITDADPVKDSFFAVPYATTITSPSTLVSDFKMMLTFCLIETS